MLFSKNQKRVISRIEREARSEQEEVRAKRRERFRILACIDGSEESFRTVRYAARLGKSKEVDIILLYVRIVDQGMRSGGLQVRVARENMLDWGLDLPGIKYLKHGLEVLKEEGLDTGDWTPTASHTDTWNDPLGDNKVEYRSKNGKSVVLKLKTAPDVVSGILDQYELGPYNLMILGEPSKWRNEFFAMFNAGVVQKVMMLAPCSVMVARARLNKTGMAICTDGTARSTDALKKAAVLGHHAKMPIKIFCVSPTKKGAQIAKEHLANAAAILKQMKIPVAETKALIGPPSQRIIHQSANSAITVVVNKRTKRLQRMVHRSVAYEVMRGAKSAVLNVR
jgi:nucleotide-binding universal stress UspA family protein